jgi:hypothetical protein
LDPINPANSANPQDESNVMIAKTFVTDSETTKRIYDIFDKLNKDPSIDKLAASKINAMMKKKKLRR